MSETPIARAHQFTLTLEPRADIHSPYPAWQGWALRDAWLAGYHAGMKDEADITESVNRQIIDLKTRVAELEDALVMLTEPIVAVEQTRSKIKQRKGKAK